MKRVVLVFLLFTGLSIVALVWPNSRPGAPSLLPRAQCAPGMDCDACLTETDKIIHTVVDAGIGECAAAAAAFGYCHANCPSCSHCIAIAQWFSKHCTGDIPEEPPQNTPDTESDPLPTSEVLCSACQKDYEVAVSRCKSEKCKEKALAELSACQSQFCL